MFEELTHSFLFEEVDRFSDIEYNKQDRNLVIQVTNHPSQFYIF